MEASMPEQLTHQQFRFRWRYTDDGAEIFSRPASFRGLMVLCLGLVGLFCLVISVLGVAKLVTGLSGEPDWGFFILMPVFLGILAFMFLVFSWKLFGTEYIRITEDEIFHDVGVYGIRQVRTFKKPSINPPIKLADVSWNSLGLSGGTTARRILRYTQLFFGYVVFKHGWSHVRLGYDVEIEEARQIIRLIEEVMFGESKEAGRP